MHTLRYVIEKRKKKERCYTRREAWESICWDPHGARDSVFAGADISKVCPGGRGRETKRGALCTFDRPPTRRPVSVRTSGVLLYETSRRDTRRRGPMEKDSEFYSQTGSGIRSL